MVLHISRASDFPFLPETEAEFGGLRQNFLLAHTIFENEFKKIIPQVLELKKRATCTYKTSICKHTFGVKVAKKQ